MRCPSCDHDNRADRRFCAECGRTGVRTLAPALCEWRAELAAALGDDVARAQLLRQAQQGDDEIGASGHVARLRQELGS